MGQILSKAVFERIPTYLHYLRSLNADKTTFISATKISKAVHFGEVLVRKDLSAVSGAGKPKIGYNAFELIEHLEAVLGHQEQEKVVIVGTGKIGRALLDYDGFSEFGMEVVAGFDSDETKLGQTDFGKPILSIHKFKQFCIENEIRVGIIAVPESKAQEVCNLMVESDIYAILNFAPTRLEVPKTVILENENIASSLAVVSGRMKKNFEE